MGPTGGSFSLQGTLCWASGKVQAELLEASSTVVDLEGMSWISGDSLWWEGGPRRDYTDYGDDDAPCLPDFAGWGRGLEPSAWDEDRCLLLPVWF